MLSVLPDLGLGRLFETISSSEAIDDHTYIRTTKPLPPLTKLVRTPICPFPTHLPSPLKFSPLKKTAQSDKNDVPHSYFDAHGIIPGAGFLASFSFFVSPWQAWAMSGVCDLSHFFLLCLSICWRRAISLSFFQVLSLSQNLTGQFIPRSWGFGTIPCAHRWTSWVTMVYAHL